MKRKHSFGRAAAAALTVLLGLSSLWPALTTEASDLTIDGSAFRDPTITKMTVYKWVEGIPGYSWSQTFGKKFPVLMTWDDKYYLKINQDVADEMSDHISGSGDDSILHGWSSNDDDSGYVNGSFNADGQYPHGYFLQNSGYPGSLLSDLDGIDYSILNQTGSYMTLSVPSGIPNLIVTWPGNTQSGVPSDGAFDRMFQNVRYAIEVDLPYTSAWYSKNYVGHYYSDGGLRQGENYLVGVRRDYCKHWTEPGDLASFWTDYHYMANGYYWTIYALNELTAREGGKPDNWFTSVKDNNYTHFKYGGVDHDYNSYPFVDYYCWFGAERTANGKKYQCFWTLGSWIHGDPYHLCDKLSDYKETKDLTNRYPKVALGHWDGNFETRGNFNGNDVLDTFNGSRSNLSGANQNEFSFRCFYAMPVIMSCLSTDFSVESGQVTNLDGPIAITNGAVITVKDGGTLTIDGWVMNNGTIKVEEGGTLYVQDGACLNKLNDSADHQSGGVISNGLIIVGEGSKLIGGGVNGIQLLNGSHVVNYGCLASENFTIKQDHTVENRDRGFVLTGSGNGVRNSGNTTYETPLDYSGRTFAERGQVESAYYVSIADNAIYES